MLILGIFFVIAALFPVYLKYRVVFHGEKCKGKIIGIKEENAGYVIRGVPVKKHAYLVQIKKKRYYTAHGCLLVSLGKRKIGKEILVFKNEKYGREVFQCFDFRIEVLALLILLPGLFLIVESLR